MDEPMSPFIFHVFFFTANGAFSSETGVGVMRVV